MKLHWSPRSPFVRKVMVVAHERGLVDRIQCVRTVAITNDPSAVLMADNPLNKIPCMILDDGQVLQDSRVICEYLDTLGDAPRLFPPEGKERWRALRRQALGDGFLDLLVIWRHERNRAPELQVKSYVDSYHAKAIATLDRLEVEAPFDGGFDMGDVTLGCALSYVDFRYADLDWRQGRPKLAEWHAAIEARPSFVATAVVNDGPAA